jgi:hypothetical protein
MYPKIDVMERECKNYNIWMHLNRPWVLRQQSQGRPGCKLATGMMANASFKTVGPTMPLQCRRCCIFCTSILTWQKLSSLRSVAPPFQSAGGRTEAQLSKCTCSATMSCLASAGTACCTSLFSPKVMSSGPQAWLTSNQGTNACQKCYCATTVSWSISLLITRSLQAMTLLYIWRFILYSKHAPLQPDNEKHGDIVPCPSLLFFFSLD